MLPKTPREPWTSGAGGCRRRLDAGPTVLGHPSSGEGQGVGVPVAQLQEVRVEPRGQIGHDHDPIRVAEPDRDPRRLLAPRLGAPSHGGNPKSQGCDPQAAAVRAWVTETLPKMPEDPEGR
jgi:hypothetical protein